MKIGFFQYDVARNRQENLERLQMQLERHPCEFVVLPELSMCGYLFSSQHELLSCAEPVPSGASTQAMLSLSKQYSCTIVFGVAEKECGDVSCISHYGKGANLLNKNQATVTTTEHKIGKTTYFVCASPSDKATDTLDKKIKKLIRKDLEQSAGNTCK